MATSKIPTPSFYHGQNYNIFKKEVRIWQKITNIEPKHQALHLICNLPGRDKDPLGIKNSLLEKADDDDLNTNDGVKKLFKLMDEFLGKDELEEAYELYEEFDSFSRSDDDWIKFITDYDVYYQRLKNKDTPLPEWLLGLKLLKAARLTDEERMIVMTGLDFSKKDELYKATVTSLKKF